jgi:hypothetical protein
MAAELQRLVSQFRVDGSAAEPSAPAKPAAAVQNGKNGKNGHHAHGVNRIASYV